MKRRDVIRHLEQNGCEFLREGANHTIYVNRAKGKASSVPRHKEINDFLGSQNGITKKGLLPRGAAAKSKVEVRLGTGGI